MVAVLKNVAAVLVGVILSALCLVSIEGFLRWNQKSHWLNPKSFQILTESSQFDREASRKLHDEVQAEVATLSWVPRMTYEEGLEIQVLHGLDKGALPEPSSVPQTRGARKVRSQVFGSKGELVYSVQVSIDERNRRITPRVRNPKAQILLFGDSFTLGEGVEDKETFAFLLAQKRPETQVYNLGVVGGSPNDVLLELQADQLNRLTDIPRRPSVVVYTFIDHHMERLIARSTSVLPENNWILDKPYFLLKGDQLELQGRFLDKREDLNQSYRQFHSMAFVDFFGLVWPLRFRTGDYQLMGKVLKAMQSEVTRRYGPDSKFFLALFPGASGVYGPRIKEIATQEGIETLDYSGIGLHRVVPVSNLPADGHPSPQGHLVFGYLLNRDLPVLRFSN